ncbi:MAG: hypothetical protein U9R79_06790 [Armatimonadota bacterium]|nr:hypothetical protein [Armatimonadota bacterium]
MGDTQGKEFARGYAEGFADGFRQGFDAGFEMAMEKALLLLSDIEAIDEEIDVVGVEEEEPEREETGESQAGEGT